MVDDAIRFVSDIEKEKPKSSPGNDNEESKSDSNEDRDQSEEEQEEEAGETTINQVFLNSFTSPTRS